jgi:hypothetical protein
MRVASCQLYFGGRADSSIFWQVKHSCGMEAFLAWVARNPKWCEHFEVPFLFFVVDLTESFFFWGWPEKRLESFLATNAKAIQSHRDSMVCLLHIDLMKVKYGARVFHACAGVEMSKYHKLTVFAIIRIVNNFETPWNSLEKFPCSSQKSYM